MGNRSILHALNNIVVPGTWGLFSRKLRAAARHAETILEQHGPDIPISMQDSLRHTLDRLGTWTLKLYPSGKPLTVTANTNFRAELSELRRALTLLAQLESGVHAIRRATTPPASGPLDTALVTLIGEIDGLRTICRIRARQMDHDGLPYDDTDDIVTLH